MSYGECKRCCIVGGIVSNEEIRVKEASVRIQKIREDGGASQVVAQNQEATKLAKLEGLIAQQEADMVETGDGDPRLK